MKRSEVQKKRGVVKAVVAIAVMQILLVALSGAAFCEPTSTTTSTPSLEISFDMETMFTWAQTIVNAMLPVVYIIMGVGLGFLIIRAFKSAFN